MPGQTLQDYKLRKGDLVALVAPSSGKAAEFHHVYKEGVKNLENIWGLNVKEFPTVRMNSETLYKHPELRAKDLNDAFSDPEVKGIITSIGGDDSVRILPFLNSQVIRKNPKFFMGYSDATVLHAYFNQLGLITFYGPSVMAGIAQAKNLPCTFIDHLNVMLFEMFDGFKYQPYESYCDGYGDWSDPENKGSIAKLKKNAGWRWLNGDDRAKGKLFGGCIEALEFLKGTKYWPKPDFWNNKILFLETSEDKPTVNQVKYMLRNYGTQGILHKISGLLFGRPNFYSENEKKEFDEMIEEVVIGEFCVKQIPIVTNMDFGHTDPQVILPLGVTMEVNPLNKTLILQIRE